MHILVASVVYLFSIITNIIVSTTKFPIVIGHSRVYFLRNGARSRGCPITTFCNWIAVIGHLRCARVNQVHLNGFFFAVFLLLSK